MGSGKLKDTRSASRQRLGLAMIVRDAEKTLGACLASVSDLVDEIVVVDTGSLDQTFTVALQYTEKIFYFQWCDDFSAARNYALEQVKSEWVLVMDADETLSASGRDWLRELKPRLHELPAGPVAIYGLNQMPGSAALSKRMLFRQWPGVKFGGRVHEQVLSDDPAMIDIYAPELLLEHKAPEPEKLKVKSAWYLGLIDSELTETVAPGRLCELWQYRAWALIPLGRLSEALDALEKASDFYALTGREGDTGALLLIQRIHLLLQLDEAEAIWLLSHQLTAQWPERPEGWFYEAYISFWRGRHDQAEAAVATLRERGVPETEIALLEARLDLVQGRLRQGLNLLESLYALMGTRAVGFQLLRARLLNGESAAADALALALQLGPEWRNRLRATSGWSPAERRQLEA